MTNWYIVQTFSGFEHKVASTINDKIKNKKLDDKITNVVVPVHEVTVVKKGKRVQKRKKYFQIQGTGNETRSFIYIDDFINAFNLIIKKGKHLGIYNIGTQERVKISKLAKIISKIFNKKIILSKNKIRRGSAKNRCPDIAKIRKLGFKKKYNLQSGLYKTIAWYKKNKK